MIFYATIGLNLFKNLLENRCRVTKYPIPNSSQWPIYQAYLGTCKEYDCPNGSYCGNPNTYKLP